jgi:hypothetical protein
LSLEGEGARAHRGLWPQWLGWGRVVPGAASWKDILSVRLSHLTHMLLNMRFYVVMGYTNVEAVASIRFTQDLVYGTGGAA